VLTSDAMSDTEVLDAIAAEADVVLGLRSPAAAWEELVQLGAWEGDRTAAPEVAAGTPVVADPASGQAVLATWSMLLDAGRLQDGEPYLAGTAHRAVARLSPARAASLAAQGAPSPGGAPEAVTVSTDRGEITLPLVVTPMPDHVVWLPSNSPGSAVRATLGAGAGQLVTVRAAGTALAVPGAAAASVVPEQAGDLS
jgi:NADH-quinone oxidoreductase subunit G